MGAYTWDSSIHQMVSTQLDRRKELYFNLYSLKETWGRDCVGALYRTLVSTNRTSAHSSVWALLTTVPPRHLGMYLCFMIRYVYLNKTCFNFVVRIKGLSWKSSHNIPLKNNYSFFANTDYIAVDNFCII